MQYTKSLLLFDDSNNIVKDRANKITYTKVGSPVLTTENAKFKYAMKTTTNQYLKSNQQIMFGDQDFTAEMFVAWHSLNTNFQLCWTAGFDNTTNNRIEFGKSTGTNEFLYGHSYNYSVKGLSVNKIYHIAYCYNFANKQLIFYVDGKKLATLNYTVPQVNRWMYIGVDCNAFNVPTNLNISEFRLSLGINRYPTEFTPPTQQFVYGPYAEFPKTITGTYDRSPNGLKYSYRVRFEQGPYTETSNVVNYVTEHKRRQPWAA